jgi:hypothetical protein
MKSPTQFLLLFVVRWERSFSGIMGHFICFVQIISFVLNFAAQSRIGHQNGGARGNVSCWSSHVVRYRHFCLRDRRFLPFPPSSSFSIMMWHRNFERVCDEQLAPEACLNFINKYR